MKKLIALLMALTMVAMMAACTNGNTETPATDATNAVDTTEGTEAVTAPAVNSALEVLETIWNAYGEDEKFAVIGGNMENAVDGAPGNYNMAYAENLTYNLIVPAELIPAVDEAASMIHMMNANTFTSGVLHLVDGTNVTEFADAMYNAISTNPWMCGFPEHMVIAVIDGSYVLIAFGVNDAMTPFQTHLSEVYPEANIVYNEALAG